MYTQTSCSSWRVFLDFSHFLCHPSSNSQWKYSFKWEWNMILNGENQHFPIFTIFKAYSMAGFTSSHTLHHQFLREYSHFLLYFSSNLLDNIPVSGFSFYHPLLEIFFLEIISPIKVGFQPSSTFARNLFFSSSSPFSHSISFWVIFENIYYHYWVFSKFSESALKWKVR